MRGRGISFNLPSSVKDLVRVHIDSYPPKESQYLGKEQYYLSAELNIKTMWILLLEKYGPDDEL